MLEAWKLPLQRAANAPLGEVAASIRGTISHSSTVILSGTKVYLMTGQLRRQLNKKSEREDELTNKPNATRSMRQPGGTVRIYIIHDVHSPSLNQC